jgi:hypothetical protein
MTTYTFFYGKYLTTLGSGVLSRRGAIMDNGMKPKWPPCTGYAYAPDIDAGHHIEMHYDENNNEIPNSDPTMHANATPEVGSFNFSAKHYSNEFQGGYGVSVDAGGVSREAADVNAQSTERGKES